MAQQQGQAQPQQQQERPLQGAQTPRRDVGDVEDDSEITGWHPGRGWRGYRDWGRGDRGFGMMRRGWMMGPGGMQSGMMMRMLFALMDSDGDGTVSLQEFQAAHERIFKAMDTNKDGVLTLQEIQDFMRGTRTAAPRQ
jgi:Ca2+-binding EF-hand superfamily protein